MTPKTVVFDLGKVLVDFDYGIAARALAERSRVSTEEMRKLIEQSSLLVTYESGGMPTDKFYSQVCDATGFCGDVDEFGRLFGDIFTAIDQMVDLHAQLRRAGVPTYILSNTNELAVAHIRRTFPFFSTFDGYILSYEVGAMKPQPAIYQALERLAGVSGSEILYIDDRLENVEAGKDRGWQIIHHQDPDPSREHVTRLFRLRG